MNFDYSFIFLTRPGESEVAWRSSNKAVICLLCALHFKVEASCSIDGLRKETDWAEAQGLTSNMDSQIKRPAKM